MMFDPRMLNDPLLMMLLSQLQQAPQGQAGLAGGGVPQQSNPDIFQDPSGVWMNNPPANPEPPAIPFVAPGDWATEQYLQQLANEAAAEKAEMDARAKLQQEAMAHQRAMELKGAEQETGRYKAEVESGTGIQKSLIEGTSKILSQEMVTPEEKLVQVQQLLASFQKPKDTGPEQPVNRPLMQAQGPALNMGDPNTQLKQIQELVGRYNTSSAPSKPSIGTKDPRFTQGETKDPQLAADIARRILVFGMSNKFTPQQVAEQMSLRQDIPQEIKILVSYYAKEYGGSI